MKIEPLGTKSPTQHERLQKLSRERREQQKDSLRHSILTAAGELFLEKGYEGFSLRQVAERIGYSATTIYRYFEDKDDLLFAIVYEGFRQFEQELRTAAEGARNPLKRIEAIGRAYISFGLQNPVYYQLMFMQRADLLSSDREHEGQAPLTSFGVLQQAVGQAVDAGALKPGSMETYSAVLWALVHGVTSLAVTGMPHFTAEELKRTTDAALRMGVEGLRKT